jgi:hypothetical protein
MKSAETTIDPESGESLEKILVELPSHHWSGHDGERVWAKPLEDGIYEIRNTPWYAYDLNWGDVVRCDGMSSADLPTVAQVIRPGGHRTLRLFFEDVGEADREQILREINRLGATYENGDDVLYGLDAEPGRSLEALLDYLAIQEEAGLLTWETGWS